MECIDIKDRVENSLTKFLELKKELPEGCKENLEIKLHNVPLYASAFLIDHENKNECKVLVDYKIYGSPRENSYGIEFRRNDKIITSKIIGSYIKIYANAREQ
jgi:uncharacterized protein Veg